MLIAVVGDSISAGSPLWDPDPSVRAGIGPSADERSQWQWWANANEPRFEFRTRAAYGKRTDYMYGYKARAGQVPSMEGHYILPVKRSKFWI